MRVYTLSDMRSEKKLRVYTASEAKGLTPGWLLYTVRMTSSLVSVHVKLNLSYISILPLFLQVSMKLYYL